MIDAKQAVQAAFTYVAEMYAPGQLKHLQLEEVEPDEGHNRWLITLGWDDPAVSPPGIFASAATSGSQRLPRTYKRFHVNADTGEVEAMRIRRAG